MNSVNDLAITAGNVTIVPCHDSTFLAPPDILQVLRSFLGDERESLRIEAAPLSESKDDAMLRLFGSWVETGNEDEILAEIYRSRHYPSTTPAADE